MLRVVAALCAVASLIIGPDSAALSYPNKPVHVIAPGGSVDLVGRVLAQNLSEILGQPVVVENKPGAGGAIGIEAVAKSPADDHTVVMSGNGAITVNAHLRPLG